MFHKVLVANRGAVARRIIRALRDVGAKSVAVYSDADRCAPHLAEADEVFAIGSPSPKHSYLNEEALLRVMAKSGADAVHPGYGFFAENASFAQHVEDAGATFIGPSTRWLAAMGHKTAARTLMAKHGMPVTPATGILPSDEAAVLGEARLLGFPVLLKPAGGGGGIGMIAADDESSLKASLERARSLAQRSFATADLFLERLIHRPRHIEFQMLGDVHGTVRHIFERDCSTQRRHQKVIEEAPAPNVDRGAIDDLASQLTLILSNLGYDNIGTIEMLLAPNGTFSFLEMNTRLQVEHAVTEAITGVDLVVAQIRAAAGDYLADILPRSLERRGHAMEARICAEDPWTHFPSPGTLTTFRPPVMSGVRVETGYASGCTVTTFYDSLLAKVIAHAPTREDAIDRLDEALSLFVIDGVKTNIPFLREVLSSADFRAGRVHTGLGVDLLSKRRALTNA